MMLHLIRSFDIPWLCLFVSLRNSLCSLFLHALWSLMSVHIFIFCSSSWLWYIVICHFVTSSSLMVKASLQHAHTPLVFVMHTFVVAVLSRWSLTYNFVDSAFWRRIFLWPLIFLVLCVNSSDFEMYVWACGSSAARWSSTRKQFKHVSNNQPVLTGLELEIVNNIVWRLLLILAMAVTESDTLERACKIYLSTSMIQVSR